MPSVQFRASGFQRTELLEKNANSAIAVTLLPMKESLVCYLSSFMLHIASADSLVAFFAKNYNITVNIIFIEFCFCASLFLDLLGD